MKKRQMKCKHCGSGDYISLDAAAHFDNELGDWVLGTMYDEEVACNNPVCIAGMRGSMDWDDFKDFEVDVATITPIVAPPADQMFEWAVAYSNGATQLGLTEWIAKRVADEAWMFTGSDPHAGRFEVRRTATEYCLFIFITGIDMIERVIPRKPGDESLDDVYEMLRLYGFNREPREPIDIAGVPATSEIVGPLWHRLFRRLNDEPKGSLKQLATAFVVVLISTLFVIYLAALLH